MSFGLPARRYGLNQLRYDLRKRRAHAPLERENSTHYAYAYHCAKLTETARV